MANCRQAQIAPHCKENNFFNFCQKPAKILFFLSKRSAQHDTCLFRVWVWVWVWLWVWVWVCARREREREWGQLERKREWEREKEKVLDFSGAEFWTYKWVTWEKKVFAIISEKRKEKCFHCNGMRINQMSNHWKMFRMTFLDFNFIIFQLSLIFSPSKNECSRMSERVYLRI